MLVDIFTYLISVKKDHVAKPHDGSHHHNCRSLVIRREDDMPTNDGTGGPDVVSEFSPIFRS